MDLQNLDDLKAYTTKELAAIYGVCNRTLNRWIKPFNREIGKRQGLYYNVAQVKIIFLKLGLPGKIHREAILY